MFRKIGIVCLVAMLLVSACSPERKLARKYVHNHKGNGILIIPQYELYLDNLTISYDTAIRYSPAQFDSMAWSQSCFIRHISDSIFLTRFTNNLVKELTELGYDVYVDGGTDMFLSLPDPKWTIQIAKLQLNEDHLAFRDDYTTDENDSFYENYRTNQVNLLSWFEVSRANSGMKQVLFLEGYIQDDYQQGIDLDIRSRSLIMSGVRDSIELDDVYKMADASGKKHAELLYDYFINDYIRGNLPSGIIDRKLFHFSRETRSLKRGLPERFDVVQ